MGRKAIITPVGMLSFPHLAAPQKAKDENEKSKYGCSIVFLPGTDINALREEAFLAAEEKFGSTGRAKLKTGALKSPFRTDIGERNYPEGSVFINVRTERKPGAVYNYPDPETNKAKVVDPADIARVFYPGAMVRVSISAYGYDAKGNKGVTFGLNNIQLVDGTTPRIDGAKAAEDEFETELAAPASMADLGAE